MLRAPILPSLCLVLIPGCAAGADGPFPSLAPRAIEATTFEEPAPRAASAIPADPKLDAMLAGIMASLSRTADSFGAASTRADVAARAARGQPVGSDAWLDAQTALAELEAIRAETGDLVSRLNEIAIGRAAALMPAYPALTKAQEQASAQSTAQTGRIDSISRTLPAA